MNYNDRKQAITNHKSQYQALVKALSENKPLIAVYDDPIEKNGKVERIGKTQLLCYYIERNGGIPILVPRESNLKEVIKNTDGYALPGGTAVDPKFYNKERHAKTWVNDEKETERFHLEESFITDAVENDKPALAICRGMQATNVILGRLWQKDNPLEKLGDRGTLIQFLPEKFPNDKVHRDENAFFYRPIDTVIWQEDMDKGIKKDPPFTSSHNIKITKNSKMHQIVGNDEIGCFSFHNQGMGPKNLAPQLTPVAYAVREDGSVNTEIIEAAEYKKILTIQSHPETGVADIADKLFSNLVKEAKEYHLEQSKSREINLDLILPYYKTASNVIKNIKLEAAKKASKSRTNDDSKIIQAVIKKHLNQK
ncbi:MAG: gamma-glutamyl-gamma-aminobutyrate hydrolase family protein [Alphaproteobacteria bacterium]